MIPKKYVNDAKIGSQEAPIIVPRNKRPTGVGKLGAKKRFPFETALETLLGLILGSFSIDCVFVRSSMFAGCL